MSDEPIKIEDARISLEKHLANNPNVLSVGVGKIDENKHVLYVFLNCDPNSFELYGWEGYHVRVRGKIVAA